MVRHSKHLHRVGAVGRFADQKETTITLRIEGPRQSGKTTLLNLLLPVLHDKGIEYTRWEDTEKPADVLEIKTDVVGLVYGNG